MPYFRYKEVVGREEFNKRKFQEEIDFPEKVEQRENSKEKRLQWQKSFFQFLQSVRLCQWLGFKFDIDLDIADRKIEHFNRCKQERIGRKEQREERAKKLKIKKQKTNLNEDSSQKQNTIDPK